MIKEKLIQIAYCVFVFLVITMPIYFLYTYAYDRAVFDTLNKIECLNKKNGATDGAETH